MQTRKHWLNKKKEPQWRKKKEPQWRRKGANNIIAIGIKRRRRHRKHG